MDGDRNSDDMNAEEHTSVPVGSSAVENKCFICHEDLDQFFHEESEEWHLKDAVRFEGITYHRLCYRDFLTTGDVGNYPLCDSVQEDQLNSGNEEETVTETVIESIKDDDVYTKSETDESEQEMASDSPDKDVSHSEEVPSESQTNGCVFSEMLQISGSEMMEEPAQLTEESIQLTEEDSEIVEEPAFKLTTEDIEMTEEPAFKLSTEDIEMTEEPAFKLTAEDVEMTVTAETDAAAPIKEEMKSEVETTFISELIEASEMQETFEFELSETDKIQTTFKPEVVTSFESEIVASDLNEILATNFLLPDPTGLVQDITAEFSENREEKTVSVADSAEAVMEPIILPKEVDSEDVTTTGNFDIIDDEMKVKAPAEEPVDNLDDLLDIPGNLPVDDKLALKVEEEANALDTSMVSNSIDGNLELSAKTTRTAAPSGVKIKINLFKKGPAAAPASVSDGDKTTNKSQASTDQSVGVGSPPSQFLDESSLTNKPRLIGRKLTLLPPTNKGVETSGLCCIM